MGSTVAVAVGVGIDVVVGTAVVVSLGMSDTVTISAVWIKVVHEVKAKRVIRENARMVFNIIFSLTKLPEFKM